LGTLTLAPDGLRDKSLANINVVPKLQSQQNGSYLFLMEEMVFLKL